MTSRMKKFISFGATLAAATMIALPAVTFAQIDTTADPYGMNAVEDSGLNLSGGEGSDVRQTAAQLINVVLSFLGIIAVIIVLVGGFKYMISGGDESKTSDARKLIVAGVVGLAIVLSAWVISTFVLETLLEATADA